MWLSWLWRRWNIRPLNVPRRIDADEFFRQVPNIEIVKPSKKIMDAKGKPIVITWDEAKHVVEDYFKPCWTSQSRVYFADRIYGLYTFKVYIDIMSHSKIWELPYEDESRDCDDFAAMAYGHAHTYMGRAPFALVWISSKDGSWAHALNGAVLWYQNEVSWWFYEPQRNRWWRGGRDKYDLLFAVV